MKTKTLIFTAIFTLFLAGCRPQKRIDQINLAHLYNMALSDLTPKYEVYHLEEGKTQVRYHFPASQLLHVRGTREDQFLGRYRLNWYIFESYESKLPLDSAHIQFTDTLRLDDSRLISETITIPTPGRKVFQLFLELEDLHRRARHSQSFYIDKTHPYAAQFFYFGSGEQEATLYAPFFLPVNRELTAHYSDSIHFEIDLKQFSQPRQTPAAPYVLEQASDQPNLQPDTSYTLKFTQGKATFSLPDHGLYYFHHPDLPRSGFSSYSFHEGYPYLLETEDMLMPLRYITSSGEYEQLFDLGDADLAVERFWIKTTGNPDRASTLMRRYYNRVEKANLYFSSHKPGWQTDRGMIYIVFGPPDLVYRSDTGEDWHYRESFQEPSQSFTFTREVNRFSYNNLVLERSTTYRRAWNMAVDKWRR